jgi:hypothetical protein
LEFPETVLKLGFTNGPGGTHTSRTMMLAELQLLLAACPSTADYDDYKTAVVDDNVLLKTTISTRIRTLRGLRELYALKPQIVLFRALRDLWDEDAEAQPLLALLCAVARDPLLRATSKLILDTPAGAAVTPEMLLEVVDDRFPDRYNPRTLLKIGRNAASSWQKSGHLSGRQHKVRVRAESRPTTVAYAFLLGYLCGSKGEALFQTLWARLLDAPAHTLHDHAFNASQQGYLEYRHTGAVTDIGFNYLLRASNEGGPP